MAAISLVATPPTPVSPTVPLNKQIIRWKPTTSPNVVAYEILKSDEGIQGTYTRHALVLNEPNQKNWDYAKSCFFYIDDEIIYRYYRIRVMDRYGNIAEDNAPTPFKAGNNPVDAPTLHFVVLNADTGRPGMFRYVTPGGSPIKDATVRVYKKIDYVTHQLDKVVGTSVTDAWGNWAPIFVEPGETYTIVWSKAYEWGPDASDITV